MTTDHGLNVSRETLERLEAFVKLVEKWTVKINLISKASIPHIWDRHIRDSVQIFDIAPACAHWLDLGSGGGFPGIVVAIIAVEQSPDTKFTLVESDQRKSAFLRGAIRELSLNGVVRSERIEALAPQNADVISARALSDLDALMGFASRHMAPTGTAIFPKGENWQKEHAAAQERWSYRCEAITSITNPAAAVLRIEDIRRV
ncbi:16S rRNA (guanine(527)-N(7))-methyltransferase RsmG [uncultured Sulfitobacter sp.]|uniref:16S rRNA (guanine(527)-N(7))-methyltransferase RsmG n=1 Tax=uncultured Sulfitobacter sp. TaxID=191468 RepID=UPI002624E111|nr:16S rRNA (guanine(527)-N(7))-methyltransferase RsmG [uncultured Sulfitobacter sp.]